MVIPSPWNICHAKEGESVWGRRFWTPSIKQIQDVMRIYPRKNCSGIKNSNLNKTLVPKVGTGGGSLKFPWRCAEFSFLLCTIDPRIDFGCFNFFWREMKRQDLDHGMGRGWSFEKIVMDFNCGSKNSLRGDGIATEKECGFCFFVCLGWNSATGCSLEYSSDTVAGHP